jgi:nucleolar complex protein 3
VNTRDRTSFDRMRARRPRFHSLSKGVPRLPIKLGDGQIVQTGFRQLADVEDSGDSNDPGESDSEEETASMKVEDVSTGARFGRPAVVDVVGIESREERIRGAKGQIASICNAIIANPENSVRSVPSRKERTFFHLGTVGTPSSSVHFFLEGDFNAIPPESCPQ